MSNKITDFADFVGKLKAAPPDALVATVRDHQLLPLFAQMLNCLVAIGPAQQVSSP